MWYYDKRKNVFKQKQEFDEDGKPLLIQYSDKEYRDLFRCDPFHYVGQDPVTKLPVQLENTAIRNDLSFWRRRREKVCFPIINRGQLWYDSLTDVQKVELQTWYKSWLDITKTYTEPAKPIWLN